MKICGKKDIAMRRIRIGKDFEVRWSIYSLVDGQKEPYALEGKRLVFKYCTPYEDQNIEDWRVEGNTIVWTFKGKDQRHIGCYQLVLVENPGEDGMVTVDVCNAFELVAYSCQENPDEDGMVVFDVVNLASDVAFNGGAGSSIDISILEGYMPMMREFSDDFNNDFTR